MYAYWDVQENDLLMNSCALIVAACCCGVSVGPTSSTNLEVVADLLRSDVRMIAIGDSFSTAFWSRVGLAGLRVWPIPRISAIGAGAGLGTPPIINVEYTCGPVENVMSIDPLGYTVDRHSKISEFFSLPIRGIKEIYTDSEFAVKDKNGNLFELSLNVDELETSVHGPIAGLGDNLRFRLLYRSPLDPQNQPNSLLIKDGDETVLSFDPRNGARKMWHLGEEPNGAGRPAISSQLNAVAIDTSAVNQLDGIFTMTIAQDTPLTNTNKYFQIAGGVYYHADENGNSVEGLYFSSLADDSWRYAGFGSNTEGTATHDKQFSLEQFTHWLDVTTLDREQPVLFVWMFDVEQLGISAMRQQHIDMIDQADEAIDLVGISQSYHLIITPHMFNFVGGGDVAHAYMQQHEDIATDLSKTRENVATVSIYSATDGVLFNGTDVANNWLVERGFDAFEIGSEVVDLADEYFGNLLDGNGIHPRNNDSALFFAAIVGNEIRKAKCPADVVGDGVIDITDLLAVVGGWGEKGPTDINNDGTTNVTDLLSVIDTWGDCWPVQAPFNTSAF
jgi:hypothetical protein